MGKVPEALGPHRPDVAGPPLLCAGRPRGAAPCRSSVPRGTRVRRRPRRCPRLAGDRHRDRLGGSRCWRTLISTGTRQPGSSPDPRPSVFGAMLGTAHRMRGSAMANHRFVGIALILLGVLFLLPRVSSVELPLDQWWHTIPCNRRPRHRPQRQSLGRPHSDRRSGRLSGG